MTTSAPPPSLRPYLADPDICERAARIRMIGLDVDGVLTDGGIYIGSEIDVRRYDSRDGVGIKLLQKAGIIIVIVTGSRSMAVDIRCRDLGITEISKNKLHKAAAMREMLTHHNVAPDEACFVGDDLPDLPLLRQLGLGMAPANACPEVKDEADVLLDSIGGHGAVREAAELLLRAQGKWDAMVDEFRSAPLD